MPNLKAEKGVDVAARDGKAVGSFVGEATGLVFESIVLVGKSDRPDGKELGFDDVKTRGTFVGKFERFSRGKSGEVSEGDRLGR